MPVPTPVTAAVEWIPQFVVEGGPVMYVLIGCSVVALGVCLERAILLRRRAVIPPDMAAAIDPLRHPQQVESLERRVADAGAPFTRIVRCALRHRHRPRADNEEEVLMEGRQAAAVLARGLIVLEVVAAIAPLLGLLGTVLGMVDVFNEITAEGLGQPGQLSSGIKEALYTTVAGLCIGIPALAAHTYFRHKAETLSLEMERFSVRLLSNLYGLSPANTPATIRPEDTPS